jgi:hypothetical protein
MSIERTFFFQKREYFFLNLCLGSDLRLIPTPIYIYIYIFASTPLLYIYIHIYIYIYIIPTPARNSETFLYIKYVQMYMTHYDSHKVHTDVHDTLLL